MKMSVSGHRPVRKLHTSPACQALPYRLISCIFLWGLTIPSFATASFLPDTVPSWLRYHRDLLRFEKNDGEWGSPIRYHLQLPSAQVRFLDTAVSFTVYKLDQYKRPETPEDYQGHLQAAASRARSFDGSGTQPLEDALISGHTYRMSWPGSVPQSRWEGRRSRPETIRRYRGTTSTLKEVSNELWRPDLYDGIDLRFYSTASGELEYDYIVHPGADQRRIRMHYEGVESVGTDESGELLLLTSAGTVRAGRPYAYQHVNGKEVPIPCTYRILSEDLVGFDLDMSLADPSLPLVIDPVALRWSSYYGGTESDFVTAFQRDATHIYMLFSTLSLDFPVTPGAFQTSLAGNQDMAIIRLNESGQREWATYIGGSGFESANYLAVDSDALFLLGESSSADFPVTPGAFQDRIPGFSSLVLLRLNKFNGSLEWSSFLGGSAYEFAGSLLSNEDRLYLLAYSGSADFPVTPGAFQASPLSSGDQAVLVSVDKLNGHPLWSTYLGTTRSTGSGEGLFISDMAIESSHLLVCGSSPGTGFPATTGALVGSHSGTGAFWGQIRLADGHPQYLSFLSGAGESAAYQLASDEDHYYFLGQAADGFAVAGDAFQPVYGGGNSDLLVAAVDKNSRMMTWSTYLGGQEDETQSWSFHNRRTLGTGDGRVFVAGRTASRNFPTTAGAHQAGSGFPVGQKFVLAAFDGKSGDALWSTYLSTGAAIPGEDDILLLQSEHGLLSVAGRTRSDKHAVAPYAFQSFRAGGYDLVAYTIDPAAGRPVCGSYYGGRNNESLTNFILEEDGRILLSGNAESFDLPVTADAVYTSTPSILESGFIARLEGCCIPVEDNTVHPASQAVCRSATPLLLEGARARYGGDYPVILRNGAPFSQRDFVQPGQYQWQVSTDGMAWTSIPGAVEQNYQPPALSADRFYRRIAACDTSAAVLVQVRDVDAPELNPGGPFVACPGDDVELGGNPVVSGANGTYTIQWEPAAIMNDPSADQPVVSPVSNTVVTATVIDAEGCRVVRSTTIYLVEPSAGADMAICAGDSIRIGAQALPPDPELTYSWSVVSGDPLAITGPADIARPLVAPAEHTLFERTVTFAGGCSYTDSVLVSLRQRPTADAGPDLVICSGDQPALGTAGIQNDVYEWLPRRNLDQYNIRRPRFAGVAGDACSRQTYVLQVRDSAAVCPVATDTIHIDVLNADAGAEGCGPRHIGTPDRSCGKFSYHWTVVSGDAASITGQESEPRPFVDPAEPTVYRVTVSYLGVTCSSTVRVPFCRCPDPEVRIAVPLNCADQQQEVPFCTKLPALHGFSITLANPDADISLQNGEICLLNPLSSEKHCEIVYSQGAQRCTTVIIFFTDPIILPDLQPKSISICPEAQGPDPVLIGQDADDSFVYRWYPSTGLSDPAAARPSVDWTALPPGTTVFTLRMQHIVSGCVYEQQTTIRVESPLADAGPDRDFCEGIFSVLGTPGVPGYVYNWSPEQGLNASDIPQPELLLFEGPGTYIYSLLVTDPATGCSSRDTLTLRVLDGITADAGPDQRICAGESVRLGDPGQPENGYFFRWEPATGLDDPTSARPLASPGSTTVYKLYVVLDGSDGCEAADEVTVEVRQSQVIPVDAGQDLTACAEGFYNIGPDPQPDFVYRWTPTEGLSDASAAQPDVFVTGDISYALLALDTSSCSLGRDTIHITLERSLPLAGQDKTICAGDTTVIGLPAIPGYSYAWIPADALSDAAAAETNASPAVTREYILSYSSSSCTFTDTVLVNVLPAPVADAGPDRTFCTGSVSLGPSAPVNGLIYRWEPAFSLSDPNDPNPLANPADTTDYILLVSDIHGCTASDTVRVSPAAGIMLDGTAYQVCAGQALDIGPENAPPGYTYNWAPGGQLNSANEARPVFTEAIPGIYTLTLTVSDGTCTRSFDFRVTVDDPGSIEIDQSPVHACSNVCIPVSATVSGDFTTIYWFPSEGVENPEEANTIICPQATDYYILTGINAATRCLVRDTLYVNVLETPAPEANAGPDQVVCLGEILVLGVPATPGIVYRWEPAAQLAGANTPQPVFQTTAAGSYTFVLSVEDSATGCSDLDVVQVDVLDFDLHIAGPDSLCAGSEAVLQATLVNNPNGLDPNEFVFAWSPAGVLSDTTGISVRFAADTSTVISLSARHIPSGCERTIYRSIGISGLAGPSVDLPADWYFCDTDTDYQVPLQPQQGLTYSWFPQAGLSNASVANPVLLAPIPAQRVYILTVSDTTRRDVCRSAELAIRIQAAAMPALVDRDYGFCEGSPDGAELDPGPGIDTSGYLFQWFPAMDLSDPAALHPVAHPPQSQVYVLEISPRADSSSVHIGCYTSAMHRVEVHPLPVARAGADTSVCSGTAVRIGGASNPFYIYTWTPASGLSNDSVARPLATVQSTTSYALAVTDPNGCIDRDTVLIRVTQPVIILDSLQRPSCGAEADGIIILSAEGGQEPYTFVWETSDGSGLQPGEAAQIALTSGTYAVTVSDAGGCSATMSYTLPAAPSCCSDIVFSYTPEDLELDCYAYIPVDYPLVDDHCCEGLDIYWYDIEIPGNCASDYILIRTFVATDDCDNETTHVQTIAVIDTLAPDLASCPSLSRSTACQGGNLQAYVSGWHEDNLAAIMQCAADQCGGIVVTHDYSFANFIASCGSTGSIEVTYSVSDSCGNTAPPITARLTITDTSGPDLSACPGLNQTVTCSGGNPQATADAWHMQNISTLLACAADGCGGTILIAHTYNFGNFIPGCSSGGTITVTYRAFDLCGNQSQPVSATLTIADTEAPDVSSCSNLDFAADCSTGNPQMAADSWHQDNLAQLMACAQDACGGLLTVIHNYSFAGFIPGCGGGGSISVTYRVVDACGNQSQPITATWSMTDQVAPVLDACNLLVVRIENCAGTDPSIRVLTWHQDNIAGLLDCATDDCSAVLTVTSDFDPANYQVTCGNAGSIAVTYRVADDCGNLSVPLTLSLILEDTTAPDVSGCTDNRSVQIDCSTAGQQTAEQWHQDNMTYILSCAGDDCASSLIVISDFDLDGIQPDCGIDTIVQVVYHVSDPCGNISEAIVFELTVSNDGSTPGMISCTGLDLVVGCDEGDIEQLAIEWDQQNLARILECASGFCNTPEQILSDFDFSGFDFSCGAGGTLTVNYTVVDNCGHLSESIQAVFTVSNAQGPGWDQCPSLDINLDCEAGDIPALLLAWHEDNLVALSACAETGCADLTDIRSDFGTTDPEVNCGQSASLIVTYQAVDECGVLSLPFTATAYILDLTPPDISECPSRDTTIICNPATNRQEVLAWRQRTADLLLACVNSSCSAPVSVLDDLDLDDLIPSCAGESEIPVSFMVMDECGNVSQPLVAILTILFPPLTDPADCGIELDTTILCTGADDPEAQVSAWDLRNKELLADCMTNDCLPDLTVISDLNPLSYNPGCGVTGTWTVNYTITDACDHILGQITAQLSVVDTVPPILTWTDPSWTMRRGDTVIIQCAANDPDWSLPGAGAGSVTATDACDPAPVVTFSETYEGSGDCTADGFFFRLRCTWTAEDACGNKDSIWFYVEIVDTVAPVILGVPEDITVTCGQLPDLPENRICPGEDQCCAEGIVWVEDACECADLYYTEQRENENCHDGYTLLRIWSAVDRCGNWARDTQRIFVERPGALEIVQRHPRLQGLQSGDSYRFECGGESDLPMWAQLLDAGDVEIRDHCAEVPPELRYGLYEIEPDGNCARTGYLRRWLAVWTVENDCGEDLQWYVHLDLIDTLSPQLTGDAIVCTSDLAIVSVSDECSDPGIWYTESDVPSVCIPGRNDKLRTWIAEDACGNQTRFDQRILPANADRRPLVIPVNPLLSGLSDGDQAELPCSRSHATYSGLASEDVRFTTICGDPLTTHFQEQIIAQGDCAADGFMMKIMVRWWAEDACGTRSDFRLEVTLKDENPPVFQSQEEHILQCGSAYPVPEAFDECSDTSIELVEEEVINNGNCALEYVIRRLFRATDACGNTSEQTMWLQITRTDGVLFTGLGPDQYCDDLRLPSVTATDACTGKIYPVQLREQTTANPCGAGQIVTRTWVATDECGIEHSRTQQIFTGDRQAPVLELNHAGYGELHDGEVLVIDCSSDPDPGGSWQHRFAVTDVTARNECSITAALVVEPLYLDGCGTTGYINAVRYTWTAVDFCGNSGRLSIEVRVKDDEAPRFISPPQDIFMNCPNLPEAHVPEVADNCSDVSVVLTETREPDGSFIRLIRTWTATDACGNSATHRQVLKYSPVNLLECTITGDLQPGCDTHGNALEVDVRGRRAPFSYHWTPIGGVCSIEEGQYTDEIIYRIGFSQTTMRATVRDADGCQTICDADLVCVPGKEGGGREGERDYSVVIGEIFPNPAYNELYVKYAVSEPMTAHIRFIDMLGREVYSTDKLLDSEKYTLYIDIRPLGPGLYYTEVTVGGEQVSRKLIKY